MTVFYFGTYNTTPVKYRYWYRQTEAPTAGTVAAWLVKQLEEEKARFAAKRAAGEVLAPRADALLPIIVVALSFVRSPDDDCPLPARRLTAPVQASTPPPTRPPRAPGWRSWPARTPARSSRQWRRS